MGEMFRFLLVGGTGAGLYVAGSMLLTQCGLSVAIASFACYAILIPCMFSAQRILTFRSKDALLESFFKYVSVQAGALAISFVAPLAIWHYTILPNSIIFLLVSVFTAVVTFHLSKFWVFSDRSKNQRPA